jgi:beta-glucanase (GH16 family)
MAVEVRAKLPTGVGTWPAIWMLGQNITEIGAYWQVQGYGTTGWPACGEIDIMEHWGHNQNYVSSAMHTPSSFGGTVNVGGQYVSGASTNYHVYALEWSETKMVFSVDSVVHYTYEPSTYTASTWPFYDPQYLLFNIAIQSSIDSTFTSSAMEVDYVRIYQQSNLSVEEAARNGIGAIGNPFGTNYSFASPAQAPSTSTTLLASRSTPTLHTESTYLPTAEYAPGMYVLEILQPGFKGYREKVIKQ